MSEPSLSASVRRPWLAVYAACIALAAWAGAFGLIAGWHRLR
jgi:hypothetical protein